MSDDSQNLRRLLLVAPGDVLASRAPLGEREKVAALLKELLPRLTFDAEWTGTFARSGQELRLQLAGDPVVAIEVLLPQDGAALMPPLERVAAKTGWRLIDPERPEPATAATAAPRSQGQRWAVVAAIVPVLAASMLWAMTGSSDSVPAGSADTSSPVTLENFLDQAEAMSAFIARQRSLAPEFKGMQVVHELMMINSAELRFQASVGNGRYVDPAMLVNDPSKQGLDGIRILPPHFIAEARGGYRFEFIGSGKGETFFEEFNPGYSSYVYVAYPESDAVGPYTFALVSETARVHYRTDGRVPDGFDASVTDQVSAESAPRIAGVPPAPNETSKESWLRQLINRFLGSRVMGEAELAYHEDRAIKDLRVFVSAQEAFMATIGSQGYGTPEVLSDPSIVGLRFRELPPFLEGYFTQEVREGYRFTFEGASPINNGELTVYPDYAYTATPVGDGPPNRRSFAVRPDGLIRFRKDGTPPQKSDTILGTER